MRIDPAHRQSFEDQAVQRGLADTVQPHERTTTGDTFDQCAIRQRSRRREDAWAYRAATGKLHGGRIEDMWHGDIEHGGNGRMCAVRGDCGNCHSGTACLCKAHSGRCETPLNRRPVAALGVLQKLREADCFNETYGVLVRSATFFTKRIEPRVIMRR